MTLHGSVFYVYWYMTINVLYHYRYLALAKPSDGEEYSSKMFIGARIQNFKFVILTQLPIPPKELLSKCYVIKIHTPTA